MKDTNENQSWIYYPAGKDSFGVNYNEFWRRGHEVSTQNPELLQNSSDWNKVRLACLRRVSNALEIYPNDEDLLAAHRMLATNKLNYNLISDGNETK